MTPIPTGLLEQLERRNVLLFIGENFTWAAEETLDWLEEQMDEENAE